MALPWPTSPRMRSAKGATNDGVVAIDKRSGPAVRVENSLNTGAGGAPHYVTQYAYGNLKAPM